ncbi:hypothetical protein [Streptomyces cyaneofuscatus]|uniref:hypothetical protein n=1 Tax=Streptomyces cyaneofuscatus TaxID=66883 RepID=UPI0036680DEE
MVRSQESGKGRAASFDVAWVREGVEVRRPLMWSSPRSGRGGDLTPRLSASIAIMGDMPHPNLTSGSIWRLHHGDQEIARLTVTDGDWPWMHADVETLPGFDEFRPLFREQERAADEEGWERIDECYFRIRGALTLTFPDGIPVAEFMLHIHDDGTAGWRWHDEPFDAVTP